MTRARFQNYGFHNYVKIVKFDGVHNSDHKVDGLSSETRVDLICHPNLFLKVTPHFLTVIWIAFRHFKSTWAHQGYSQTS
jgi:hypothetical protein